MSHLMTVFIMTILMFVSIIFSGGSYSIAFLLSLIPLVLGGLNILSRFAYSASAVAFIVSILQNTEPFWRKKLLPLISALTNAFH